ncbi:MAG: tetratricopeptide repeat protein [Bacteroidetes bacterium]|nr:tetratricopeptide repeat protein [Bacteroidota bacterium]MCW5895841.1 tetratricopeptide repeat protein [Bacteroidota bacterium]
MPGPINISASFAREAANLLQNNEVQHAMELCMAGIRVFPAYATGYLVLGKCYEAIGKKRDASAQYQEALKRLPDNPTLLSFVKKLDEALQKELQRQMEEQRRTEATGPQSPPPPQPEEVNEETAFDILTKKLRNVKRIQSDASSPPPPPPTPNNVTFATSTMAEIFVKQGNYAEAIAAYKELASRTPDEHYTQRIAELEKLLELKKKE